MTGTRDLGRDVEMWCREMRSSTEVGSSTDVGGGIKMRGADVRSTDVRRCRRATVSLRCGISGARQQGAKSD